MTDDNGGQNQDGGQNQGPKMVPENNLMAVKANLTRVEANLAEVLQKADSHYQSLLTEKASREAAEGKLVGFQSQLTELEDLKTQLTAAVASREQLESRLLDLRVKSLATEYDVAVDTLKGKKPEELDALEQALKLVGPKRGSGIDRGGGGGSQQAMSARDKILAGLEERTRNRGG